MNRLVACGALIALALSGCASAPTHFYTLAAPLDAPATARPLQAPVYIEFAPLALPRRLARPQMVLRSKGDADSGAKVDVLEAYRWSSSFEFELRDALADGVARRLGAVNSTLAGRTPGQAAWRVLLQVGAFDAIEDERIDVALNWTVRRTDRSETSACEWSASEAVGPGIDALAQGAQRVTSAAADAIARHIAALEAKTAPDCMTRAGAP
ncbi:MAG TPA: ABC-type transport auxiliary lipoprotein family protein [Variovorax sp.]|jgi:hypothetical protein